MTSINNEKQELRNAFGRWHRASNDTVSLKELERAWQAVEDAILALDNAAYARAEEKIRGEIRAEVDQTLRNALVRLEAELLDVRKDRDYRKRCAKDWHQTAIDRAKEIERLRAQVGLPTSAALAEDLMRDRDEERQRTTTMTLANDDKRQEIRRLEAERGWLHQQWARCLSELADARKTIKRLASDADITPIRRELETERTHRRALQEKIAALRTRLNLVEAETTANFDEMADWQADALDLRRERDAARAALASASDTIWRLADDGSVEHLAQRVSTLRGELREANLRINNLRQTVLARVEVSRGPEADRLRKALETLADRYHAQMCYKSRRYPHSRRNCSHVLAIKDANAALGGPTMGTLLVGTQDLLWCAPGCKACAAKKPDPPRVRKAVGEQNEAWQIIEQEEDPDIEAVLIGSRELQCADGCGRVVKQGNVMYRRSHLPFGVVPHLYATKECARTAAKLATFMRENEYPPTDPVRCRCTLPEQPKPDITDLDVLRACRSFHEQGDGTPFSTLAGDFPVTVITAKMQAMVATGLLKYDTNLSTARATLKGKCMLKAADEAERR